MGQRTGNAEPVDELPDRSQWRSHFTPRSLRRSATPFCRGVFCECGGDGSDPDCEERVHMTIEEYEEVRAQDDRFAVYPGHETEALEWIARRDERFVLVDKLPEAEPFVEDDPRGAPSR